MTFGAKLGFIYNILNESSFYGQDGTCELLSRVINQIPEDLTPNTLNYLWLKGHKCTYVQVQVSKYGHILCWLS